MGRAGVMEETKSKKRRVPRKKASDYWCDKVNKDIEKLAKKRSAEIAEKLVNGASQGDIASLRVMLSLHTAAVKGHAQAKDAARGESQADAWAQEPEWSGELSEACAEMRAGGVEPEG